MEIVKPSDAAIVKARAKLDERQPILMDQPTWRMAERCTLSGIVTTPSWRLSMEIGSSAAALIGREFRKLHPRLTVFDHATHLIHGRWLAAEYGGLQHRQ